MDLYRLACPRLACPRTTYSYDAANQTQKYIDNTGTTTFAFDANGNQRLQQTPSSGTTTNTWDFKNRLTKVALPTGILTTFTYNGDGLRVEHQDSSGTSKHILDGQKIVEETDQNNVPEVVYTQSTGVYGDAVSTRQSGAATYLLFDPLGSVARITDGNQSTTDSYIYSAFGELIAGGSTTNRLRYVGMVGYYWNADTSNYAVRLRELAPSIARFLSVEPIQLRYFSNNYGYVRNRPCVSIDPSGALPCAVNSFSLIQTPPQGCGFWAKPYDKYGVKLEITASFGGVCGCCAYRQYILGTQRYRVVGDPNWTTIASYGGAAGRPKPLFVSPCGQLGGDTGCITVPPYQQQFCEDVGASGFAYGHQPPAPLLRPDPELQPAGVGGCTYAAIDYPGIAGVPGGMSLQDFVVEQSLDGKSVEIEMDLHFIGRIIDTCCRCKVEREMRWDVYCHDILTPAIINDLQNLTL